MLNKRALDWLRWLERGILYPWQTKPALTSIKVIMVVPTLAIMLLMCGEILSRYVLAKPWLFFEEVVLYLVFWSYFWGAIYATYERTHIKAALLEAVVKNPLVVDRIRVIIQLFTLMLCCFYSVLAWRYTAWGFRMGEYAPMTGWPMVYAQLPISIGLTLVCIYFLTEWRDQINKVRRHRE